MEFAGDLAAMAKSPTSSPRRPQRNFVREWRLYRNMTLEEVAEAADLDTSMVSMIENGKSGYSWQSIEDIASALDCTTADLLGGPPSEPDNLFLSEVRKLDPEERPRALEMMRLLRGGATRPFRIVDMPAQDEPRASGLAEPQPTPSKRRGPYGKPAR